MARKKQKTRQHLSRVEAVRLTMWVVQNKEKLETERKTSDYWADRATSELKFEKQIGAQSFRTVCLAAGIKWHDHAGVAPENRGRPGGGNRMQQLIAVTQLIAKVVDRMAMAVGYDMARDAGLALTPAEQMLWQRVLSPDYNLAIAATGPAP
jgi:hypothetical protein